MSWPTSSSGQRKDPYGRRGANEVARHHSEHHASCSNGYDRDPAPARNSAGEAGAAGPLPNRHHSGIEITDIQVRLVDNERLRAWATITFNNAFVIKGIRVIQGNNRLFVAMPSKQQKDGKYQDIAHPINPDFRNFLEQRILDVHRRIEAEAGVGVVPASIDDGDDY